MPTLQIGRQSIVWEPPSPTKPGPSPAARLAGERRAVEEAAAQAALDKEDADLIRAARRQARQHLVHESLSRSGGNVKRAARETTVPESTVRRWKTEWLAKQAQAGEGRD